MPTKKTKKKVTIRIGKKAYKGSQSDYEGLVGEIYFCKCCRECRIQFENIANNASLSRFDVTKCEITYSLPLKAKKKTK